MFSYHGDRLEVRESLSERLYNERMSSQHTLTHSTHSQQGPVPQPDTSLVRAQIEGQEYVVTALVLQYKLRRGRYVRDHNRLEVQRTGRFLYNGFLDRCMQAPPHRRGAAD